MQSLVVLLLLLACCSSALRLSATKPQQQQLSSRRKLLHLAPLALLAGASQSVQADDGKIIGQVHRARVSFGTAQRHTHSFCACFRVRRPQIPASGIIFKDIVKVERIEDPKVQGIELYVSDFQRPITDRLAQDFFSDPTQAAVTCVRIGPMTLADDIDTSEQGEEVFQQARSLLFKSVNVRRLYDKEKNTLIYVAYSTRLNKGDDENKSRFKTTMCALPVQ